MWGAGWLGGSLQRRHGHAACAARATALTKPPRAAPAALQTVKARPGVKPNYRQIAMLREWAAQHLAQEKAAAQDGSDAH